MSENFRGVFDSYCIHITYKQKATDDELTDAKKCTDVVENLARLRNVILITDHFDLFHRKNSQPVGQEWVIHSNPQPNLHKQTY